MTDTPINQATDVLVIVDVQNDFCPTGALAVVDGDAVVTPANRLSKIFLNVVLTQDWHPPRHQSFASSHAGKAPYDVIDLPYGPQVLWPDHCVQGTPGAAFHDDLRTDGAELIVRKGFRPEIDSYSALYENDQTTPTGLAGYLRERGLARMFLCGLATDFCVKFSALDARKEGFQVVLVEDACRGIDLEGSLAAAMRDMADAGVTRINSADLTG